MRIAANSMCANFVVRGKAEVQVEKHGVPKIHLLKE
jgi:hypothetical protein